MRGNELLDKMENAAPEYIEAAGRYSKKKRNARIRWAALAACLCLCLAGAFAVLQRADIFEGEGCSASPGTMADGSYYYMVDHSGIWRYSDGNTEKILSTFRIDGDWAVNGNGLYYGCGRTVYRMDLETHRKTRIFSTTEGTHIGFELTSDGNVIITVYDKNERFKYQVLVDGENGDLIARLTEKISYDSDTPMYTDLHYQVGERRIELVRSGGDEKIPHYMPTENGVSLLPEGYWVSDFGCGPVDGVLLFEVYREDETVQEEIETLVLFADGETILEPEYCICSGATGHILLYVDTENPENLGSNGCGIWCLDADSGEKWQLDIDAESEFYSFTNDDHMLFSCVPWSEEQTAWKIVFEGDRPVSLQLVDTDITE